MTDKTSIQNLPEMDHTLTNKYDPSYNPHYPPENHRLPSRDIIINPSDYNNDNQIKANYIPPVKKVKDYIKNYREDEYLQSRSHKRKKNMKLDLLHEFILLTLMMFIFQIPIVNTIIHTYCHSLGIHKLDGQFNNKGILFKASIFSFLYLCIEANILLLKCM